MAPNDSSNRTCDLSIAANLIFLAKKSAQVASASNYLTVAIIMFTRRRGEVEVEAVDRLMLLEQVEPFK